MKRVIILGDEQKKAIDTVVAFAMQPENWYRPEQDGAPGDVDPFVVTIPIGVRCVFTITAMSHGTYRHLSIGVDDRSTLINPVMAFDIEAAFGFTGYDQHGAPDDWIMEEYEGCFVIFQRLTDA